MTHVKIEHDAWILIGDGRKALILRNQGDEVYPNLVLEQLVSNDNPPNSTARETPANDAAPGGGDRPLLEEVRFAKEVADQLYKNAHHGDFDRLVVVAPPRILGTLREAFHPEVRERIVAEIDKTLTQHPVPEIERILTRH